jgi:hypothetical protein
VFTIKTKVVNFGIPVNTPWTNGKKMDGRQAKKASKPRVQSSPALSSGQNFANNLQANFS